MTDPDHRARLRDLEARLDALKAPKEVKPHVDERYSLAHLAWRMVIELVVGLLIGFGIGYGLDSLLGTSPVFLVLFTLLGLAAGINVMIRSAREVQQAQMAAEAAEQVAADAAGQPPERGKGKRAENGS